MTVSLDLLPYEEPRLVAGFLVTYPGGATQYGPVEGQDAGALEELQAQGAVHQRLRPACVSQRQQQPARWGTRTHMI